MLVCGAAIDDCISYRKAWKNRLRLDPGANCGGNACR